MLSKEVKKGAVYQDALALMENPKPKAIQKWGKEKLKQAHRDYARISEGMFATYETALQKYVSAMEAAHSRYQSAGPTRKELILEELVTKDRKNLANAIKTMDAYRKDNKSTSQTTSTPKKSGRFKHFLVWTGLIGSLIGGYFWGNKNAEQKNGPQEGDSVSARMEQRINSSGGRVYQEQGNGGRTAVQPGRTPSGGNASLTTGLKERVKGGMTYANTPMGDQEYNNQMAALRQQANIAAGQVTVSGLNAQRNWNEVSSIEALRAGSRAENEIKVDTANANRRLLEEIEGAGEAIGGIIDRGNEIANKTDAAARNLGDIMTHIGKGR